MKNSHPPLLRAIGTTLIIASLIFNYFIRVDVSNTADFGGRGQIAYDVSSPFDESDATAAKERFDQIFLNDLWLKIDELHEASVREDFVNSFTNTPFVFWLGAVGMMLIASSYYVEWMLKKD